MVCSFGFQVRPPPFAKGGSHPEVGPPDSERVNYWTNPECLPTLPKLYLVYAPGPFYVNYDLEQNRFSPYHAERTFSFCLEGRIRVLGCLPHRTKKVRRGMGCSLSTPSKKSYLILPKALLSLPDSDSYWREDGASPLGVTSTVPCREQWFH